MLDQTTSAHTRTQTQSRVAVRLAGGLFEDSGGSGDEALGLVDGLLVGGQVAFAQGGIGPVERP